MSNYLEGFNDGYNKAIEQFNKGDIVASIQMNQKEIARLIYKEVTELQEKDKQRLREFAF